jgi:predicted GNAT superfamily acetyltransferase
VLLARQVQTIYWTFDPLDAKNAHINFARLGILAREYRVNMYGGQTDSPLHRGIGTDRLIAVWPIGAARVQERLAGNRGTTPAAAATIEIPLNIHEINATQPEVARAWRERTRAEFTRYLERGYVVVDFLRHENGGHYVLGAAPGLDK